MNIKILGCGSSTGVPIVGCICDICASNNFKNKRLRSSILIQDEITNILVDTSPDLRIQALANNIMEIDAIIYTHAHADHINGIDDVRGFNFVKSSTIPIYSNFETINTIKRSFPYAFQKYHIDKDGNFYSSLEENIMGNTDSFRIGNIFIEMFEQIHGKITSLGIKINDRFAYSTDVSNLPDDSIDKLKNIDLWIVDCLSEEISKAHANFDKILEWNKVIKPCRMILTHLSHKIDFDKLSEKLPNNIELAYDNMNIII